MYGGGGGGGDDREQFKVSYCYHGTRGGWSCEGEGGAVRGRVEL